MSKTTKRSSRRSSSKRAPIRWQQIERWLDYGGGVDDWKRAHLDQRLFTIAPAFEGILDGLKGHTDVSAADKAEIIALAKRACGTSFHELFRRDHERVLVVCDWLCRCALPLWLDRLPTWCIARDSASRLRKLTGLFWTQQIVDALAVLSPIWISLGAAARDRGTADERTIVFNAEAKAMETMQVLGTVLPRNMDFGRGDDRDAWIAHMALRLLRDSKSYESDLTIKHTLPALIEVLFAVQNGDSRQSIADRCVWPVPSKTRAA